MKQQDTKVEFKEMEEMVDASGNTVKLKKSKKELSKKEQKAKARRRALKIKNGEPLSSDEEDEDWYGDHPLDAVMERLARETMGPDAKTVRVGDGVTVVMPGQIMNVIDGFGDGNGIQAASVKLKRKRKMAKHKHRKRRKRDRNKG